VKTESERMSVEGKRVRRGGAGRSPDVDELPPPVVAADCYDADYYLCKCAGRESWVTSGGTDLDPLYLGCLLKAGVNPGDVVVDIGTGRAELPVVAVREGARLAVGIEYSWSALELGARTVAASGVGDRILLMAADARKLPLPDGCADLVTLLDVVEHLAPDELARCLAECHRILRPKGRVLAHTMPNRLVYDVTYRIQRLARRHRRLHWPADPRQEIEHLMHVNEQTRRSLVSYLRGAGFASAEVTHGEWIWEGFVPDEKARALYHRLSRFRLTAALGRGDLWAVAQKDDP
jgi:ubiquinone/menaquinone biosynthesis C-methylase UbiE